MKVGKPSTSILHRTYVMPSLFLVLLFFFPLLCRCVHLPARCLTVFVFALGKSLLFRTYPTPHSPQVMVVLRCYLGVRVCMFFLLCVCVFMCQPQEICIHQFDCGSSELQKIALLTSGKMWWDGEYSVGVCVLLAFSVKPDPRFL